MTDFAAIDFEKANELPCSVCFVMSNKKTS